MEATSTAVVDSLTLVTTSAEPAREVSAADGVYYAIRIVGRLCPYPRRARAWPVLAFLLPRRLALELAVRTFLETQASLVVVAFLGRRPAWLVFELACFPARDRRARRPARG